MPDEEVEVLEETEKTEKEEWIVPRQAIEDPTKKRVLSTFDVGQRVKLVAGWKKRIGWEADVLRTSEGAGVYVRFDDGQRKWVSPNSLAIRSDFLC